MNENARRVAILGGNRIPFARPNGPYAHASNQDMLTAALDGLVARSGSQGEPLGEVAAGAVLKHSRDFNLTRESVLGSRLAPETPAYDVQQACGTGLETTILVANKIALGQIDCGDRRRRRHHLRRAARRQRGPARGAARAQPGQVDRRPAAGAGQAAPAADRARDPAQRRAAHRPVDGRALRDHGRRSGGSAARSRTSWRSASHRNLAAAYDTGFLDDLVTPFLGLERDQNLRPDSTVEKLAKLKPVFGGPEGTMTAGNSTPLTDGASAVLLASEEWAAAHGLPVLAYFTDAQTAAVDYVHKREGLLMAPAYAMPRMLARAGLDAAGLRLLRDPRGVRLPGAVHAEGVGGPGVLPRAPRPRRSRSARSTATGSTSTAARSAPAIRSAPPAAGSSPRWPRCSASRARAAALISICAAGGLGVTAILEAA